MRIDMKTQKIEITIQLDRKGMVLPLIKGNYTPEEPETNSKEMIEDIEVWVEDVDISPVLDELPFDWRPVIEEKALDALLQRTIDKIDEGIGGEFIG